MPLTGAFHLSRRVVNSAPPSSFFTLAFLVFLTLQRYDIFPQMSRFVTDVETGCYGFHAQA